MKRTLADLRNERNMKQRELATALGMSPSAIALYELGQRTPSLQRAKQIARFFGVPVEDIVFGPLVCDGQAATRESA